MTEQTINIEKTVNSFKFVPGLTRRVVRSWIKRERQSPRPQSIPWTPLSKPLADCSLALISTAGLVLKEEQPFDQEGERQNPWWGDPSYRLLPHTVSEKDIRLCHLHVNPIYTEQDLNCIFPLQRLRELVDEPGPSGAHSLLLHGLYSAAASLIGGERAGHDPPFTSRESGRGSPGTGLTFLLLVRRTGTTGNRSQRHLHHFTLPYCRFYRFG